MHILIDDEDEEGIDARIRTTYVALEIIESSLIILAILGWVHTGVHRHTKPIEFIFSCVFIPIALAILGTLLSVTIILQEVITRKENPDRYDYRLPIVFGAVVSSPPWFLFAVLVIQLALLTVTVMGWANLIMDPPPNLELYLIIWSHVMIAEVTLLQLILLPQTFYRIYQSTIRRIEERRKDEELLRNA